jgi:hypothetical protein
MASLGWYPIKNGTAARRSLGEVTVVMGEASVERKVRGEEKCECVEKLILLWISIS